MSANRRMVVYSEADSAFDASARQHWFEAARLLKPLAADGIAVVLLSLRTRAELEHIQDRLGIEDPFVVERGSAVRIPRSYFRSMPPDADTSGGQTFEFGRRRDAVLQSLRRAAAMEQVDILTFSDLSVDELAWACDVSRLEARLMHQREYSERFRLLNPTPAARERLRRALEALHLHCGDGPGFGLVDASHGPNAALSLLDRLYGNIPRASLSSQVDDIVSWARSLVDMAAKIDADPVNGHLQRPAVLGEAPAT